MNDRKDDGYSLTRNAIESIEAAAARWARAVRIRAGDTTDFVAMTSAIASVRRVDYMPEWLGYDADYQDFDAACDDEEAQIMREFDAREEAEMDKKYSD